MAEAAQEDDRLVIALDYGTTYTGIAIQPVTRDWEDNPFDVDDIRLLDDWFDRVSFKVPSEISYSPATRGGRQYRQWGFDISPGSFALQWTKLELDQQQRPDELQMILDALIGMDNLNFNTIKQSDGLPSYPGKDPVDVVADYLEKIREHLLRILKQEYSQEYLSITPIDLVVTVPAIWSLKAKDRTFHAIDKAGFNARYFQRLRDVILVTEPEASAVYTLKSLLQQEDEDFIEPGDCFVMCDAGGGTVDVISYRVRQLLPTLELEEVTLGTGAKCGATFIDRKFKEWLAQKIGHQDYQRVLGRLPENDIGSHHIVEPQMRRIMTDFEAIKRSFDGTNPREGYISLPEPLSQMNDPTRDIQDGDVRITNRDLQGLFNDCVDRTIQLIAAQIGLVEHEGYRARYVFLSGGFGMSKYLFNEVRKFARVRNIEVKSTGNPPAGSQGDPLVEHRPWSAVVRGAVIRGLEKHKNKPIYMRKCPRHYGISVSQPFSTFKHLESDSYTDPFDGERKAKDQMVWLIKKGDALLSNKSKQVSINLCRRFGLRDPRVFQTSLVAYDDDQAPQRYSDVLRHRRTLTTLNYDFNDIPEANFESCRAGSNGQPYYCAYFRVEINLEGNITFKVTFNGEQRGALETNFV